MTQGYIMTLTPTGAALALVLATSALAAPHDHEWLRIPPEELPQPQADIATPGQFTGQCCPTDVMPLSPDVTALAGGTTPAQIMDLTGCVVRKVMATGAV